METLKNRVKSARVNSGMSQQDLADRLGITKQSISQYERGAGCRRFESCHPDMRKKSEKPRNSEVFQTFSIEKTDAQSSLFWMVLGGFSCDIFVHLPPFVTFSSHKKTRISPGIAS